MVLKRVNWDEDWIKREKHGESGALACPFWHESRHVCQLVVLGEGEGPVGNEREGRVPAEAERSRRGFLTSPAGRVHNRSARELSGD